MTLMVTTQQSSDCGKFKVDAADGLFVASPKPHRFRCPQSNFVADWSCLALPSDLCPRAPYVPTDKLGGFHPSTTMSFNCPVARSLRRSKMVPTPEISVKRTIRKQQLREIVPLADSTIYEMERRGEFPRRFALSPRCIIWDLAEVEAWLASRRSTPIGRAQSPDVRLRQSRPVREPGRVQAAASKAG